MTYSTERQGWKQVSVFGECWQWEHPVTVAFPPLLLPLHKLGGKKRCLFIPMNSQTEPRSCWPPCKHKRVPQGRTSPTDFISNKHLFPSPCKLHVHLKVILPVVSLSHYPDSEGHLPPFHLTPATGEPTRQHRNSGAVTVLLLLPGQAQNCRAAYQIKMLWIGREITSTPGVQCFPAISKKKRVDFKGGCNFLFWHLLNVPHCSPGRFQSISAACAIIMSALLLLNPFPSSLKSSHCNSRCAENGPEIFFYCVMH